MQGNFIVMGRVTYIVQGNSYVAEANFILMTLASAGKRIPLCVFKKPWVRAPRVHRWAAWCC